MSLLKSLVLLSSGAISQVPAGDTTADWNNLANKPATFPPAVHSHVIADVTGLQTALDAKVAGPASANSGAPVLFDGATGKLVRETTYAAFKASLAIVVADVGGLQGALDAKLNASAYTAADVLAKMLTVDGVGSGLDADLLDGQNGAYYLALANHTGSLPVGSITGLGPWATGTDLANATGLLNGALIDVASIPLGRMVVIPDQRLLGNISGASASASSLTATQAATLIGLDAKFPYVGGMFTGRVQSDVAQAASSGMATAASSLGGFELRSQGNAATAGAAYMCFLRTNAFGAYFGIDTDNSWKVGGWSMGANAYKLWHEGNDGSGSGLNADELDGRHDSYYLNIGNATGTLDPARIATDTIPYSKLVDTAGLSVIGNPTNVAANAQDITATASGQVLHRLSGALVFAQLPTASYLDGSVTYSKMQDVAIVSVMGNPTAALTPPQNIQATASGQVLQRVGSTLAFATYNLSNAVGTLPDASLVGAYTGITALTMSGSLNIGGHVLAIATNVMSIRATTADGADTCVTNFAGGGNNLNSRGAYISAYGNEHATLPGRLSLNVGAGASATCEIAGNVNIAGNLTANNLAAAYLFGSKSFTWPAGQLNQATATTTVAVTGAATTDLAIALNSTWANGLDLNARVTSAGVVTVYLTNNTGSTQTLGAGTLSVIVFKANPLALMAEARPANEDFKAQLQAERTLQ